MKKPAVSQEEQQKKLQEKLSRRQKYFEEKQFYEIKAFESEEQTLVEWFNTHNLVQIQEGASVLEEIEKIVLIKFKEYELFGEASKKQFLFATQFVLPIFQQAKSYDFLCTATNFWMGQVFNSPSVLEKIRNRVEKDFLQEFEELYPDGFPNREQMVVTLRERVEQQNIFRIDSENFLEKFNDKQRILGEFGNFVRLWK